MRDKKPPAERNQYTIFFLHDTIVLEYYTVDEQKHRYAVILRATRNVQTALLKKHFRVKNLTLILREKVLEEIGFPAGGVPPFGFHAQFIIDADLHKDEIVYAGGGTIHTLLCISVSEIRRGSHALVMDIGKDTL